MMIDGFYEHLSLRLSETHFENALKTYDGCYVMMDFPYELFVLVKRSQERLYLMMLFLEANQADFHELNILLLLSCVTYILYVVRL